MGRNRSITFIKSSINLYGYTYAFHELVTSGVPFFESLWLLFVAHKRKSIV